MLSVFIRAVILYLLLIFAVRLMGKRQIGELQPSELAITILISNIATLPLEDVDIPLITGIIPIFTLASLDVVMSWFSIKSKRLRDFICGKPVVIIQNGKVDQKKLRDIRFSSDDLIQALRGQGVYDLGEVQFAVVETTGSLSIYQKRDYRSVTAKDMGIKGESDDPPAVIIDDGKLIKEVAESFSLNQSWIDETLKKEGVKLNQVFLMTVSPSRRYSLIKKE